MTGIIDQIRSLDNKALTVWRFEDAPKQYRDLSTNGGDEDWILLIPPGYDCEWIGWAERGGSFGVCCVDRFTLDDGSRVWIGSHA
jgi:hypothetical protein